VGLTIDPPPMLNDLDGEDSLFVPFPVEDLDAPGSGVGYYLEHTWDIGDT